MPLVTTIAKDEAEAVLLLIDSAEPVVAPLMESITIVEDPVIEEFVKVKVRSAAAAILTVVKVTVPDRPLTTTAPDAAPELVGDVSSKPVPEVVATKLPLDAVIAPDVAVKVVDAVTDVGATKPDGIDRVTVLPLPTDVI